MALHDRADAAPTPSRSRRPYEARHARRYAIVRRRPTPNGACAAAPELGRDPFLRPRLTGRRRLAALALLVVGSLAVHAGLLFGFAVVSAAFTRSGGSGPRHEKIEITVVEPTPAPVEPPPRDETRRAPVPRVAPAPKARKNEPPPAPVKEATPAEPAAAPPRRIVGLSLESTTVGGGGAAFAVGNTRLGATAAVAEDPYAARGPLAAENRVSNRVPTGKVAFRPPQKQREVRPDYPAALRTAGIEADVVLAVVVSPDGSVGRVEVIKSPPEPEFAAAALAAARAETYAPATRDGIPIEQLITFTVRFRLTDT